MNVLVPGGTGFVGRHLTAELAERGHDVTALSREPDADSLHDDVETAIGDVTAYDSIEPHFEGMDAVVNLVALSPLFKTPAAAHDRLTRQGTEHCIQAAEAHDVGRFVYMSGIHADPEASTAYLRAKGEAEAAVRESALSWVIYRPTIVFGEGCEIVDFVSFVTTPFVTPLPGGGRVRYQPIAVEDLAPMLADGVEDDDRDGEIYELGGPEVLSLADLTRLIYRARGRSIRILPVPTSLAKVGLQVAEHIPFAPLGADQGEALDTNLVVETNDVDAFGTDPAEMRTVAEFLGVDGAGERVEVTSA
ncbi:MAG: complex I NDUFA9 subunit family protein [Haloarculaceae archaeon]